MKARMSEVLGPPKAFLPGRRLRQSQPVLLGSGPPCALRGGAAPGQCTGAAQTTASASRGWVCVCPCSTVTGSPNDAPGRQYPGFR